jgi:hypothetical protein
MSSARAGVSGVSRIRARVLPAETNDVLLVDRLVARRENVSCGGVVEYCVKWTGVGWDGCSWESRDALLHDVPGLVLAFDARHPELPSRAVGETREPPAAEVEEHFKRMARVEAREQAEAVGAVKPEPMDKPISVPAWFDSPLVDLTFSGMTLHMRPNEWNLFADSISAARDLKKRRIRFRLEFPEEYRRLFPISKAELAAKERADAKTLIDLNVKKRKQASSVPIVFPRALGTVIRTDLAPPVPRADIARAPPSWERYFMDLGLECTNWERELPPDMPTADPAVHRAVKHAVIALVVDERGKAKERTERLVQERMDKEPGGVAGIGASVHDYLTKVRLATSGRTRVDRLDRGVGHVGKGGFGTTSVFANQSGNDTQKVITSNIQGAASTALIRNGDTISSHTASADVQDEQRLLRERIRAFGDALKFAALTSDSESRWYDPVWCCWRYKRSLAAAAPSSQSGSTLTSKDTVVRQHPPGSSATISVRDVSEAELPKAMNDASMDIVDQKSLCAPAPEQSQV